MGLMVRMELMVLLVPLVCQDSLVSRVPQENLETPESMESMVIKDLRELKENKERTETTETQDRVAVRSDTKENVTVILTSSLYTVRAMRSPNVPPTTEPSGPDTVSCP